MRDLEKDLEAVRAWLKSGSLPIPEIERAYFTFVQTAYEGFEEAIKRAMEAEAENQRLRSLLALALEASCACEPKMCGTVMDKVGGALKEATP